MYTYRQSNSIQLPKHKRTSLTHTPRTSSTSRSTMRSSTKRPSVRRVFRASPSKRRLRSTSRTTSRNPRRCPFSSRPRICPPLRHFRRLRGAGRTTTTRQCATRAQRRTASGERARGATSRRGHPQIGSSESICVLGLIQLMLTVHCNVARKNLPYKVAYR